MSTSIQPPDCHAGSGASSPCRAGCHCGSRCRDRPGQAAGPGTRREARSAINGNAGFQWQNLCGRSVPEAVTRRVGKSRRRDSNSQPPLYENHLLRRRSAWKRLILQYFTTIQGQLQCVSSNPIFGPPMAVRPREVCPKCVRIDTVSIWIWRAGSTGSTAPSRCRSHLRGRV